ncbi:MAG: ATP-grasp domain-containing protein [Nannocystis sp.]|uniref:acetyl-CoA carboxylase biotin carboxylase subunit n=1 Tax=Nannocystis sp. TaxID=1962667 RepID=UPI002424D32F|nr:biotin carboxylase N-terminal domain-containing protein [Nannocystis sp.]MBK9753315.1 ATP-grasp domain-containing protein [Nannocystis sp.]
MTARGSLPAAPPLFRRLMVGNRGEVAVRISRACDALGITPVLAVSAADRGAAYTQGRETVCLGGPRSTQSYLDMRAIVQAARQSECSALHPGWGFLSENPVFAALCEAHGVTFIGPPAHAMHRMGKKTPAKAAMRAAGLQLIPGSDGILASVEEAQAVAERVGYPVLLKAESGGGGRGMRIARGPDEVAGAYADAQAEASAAFADGRLYLERLIEGGRHIEIQILADRYGHVIHLGERDCTVQRNHQKLIEESPSPVLPELERSRTLAAAVRAAASIGYVGAGTMEFLLDQGGTLRFMEMNTRLQVEHCVSEQRSGVDLVIEQIRVAAGHRLSLRQQDIVLRGHAIECRINAEDTTQNFRPAPGRITRWHAPASEHLRVDTHVQSGYEVPPHYDSLLCKLIASGDTRDQAIERMIAALTDLVCEGVPTTVPVHLAILRSPAFRDNHYDTRSIPGWPPA